MGGVVGRSGRPKGSKNKMPGETRAYVLAVVEQLEVEGKGLYQWALENPNEFWSKVFKAVIPKPIEVTGAGGGPLEFAIRLAQALERADEARRISASPE